jgi:SAM-dependent methyltransferase
MITAYWTSQAIYAAARLSIPDLLKDGPRTVADLAQAASAHPASLYRLLRALASIGIFAETTPRTFQLTPLAEVLRSDVPGTQRPLALMLGDEQYQAWGHLVDSVRTGETAFDTIYGKPVFDYLADHPEQAAVFDAAMTAIHGRETAAMLEAYDFGDIGLLADIGGGNGSKITAILQRYPSLRGLLFDLPHVVERARPHIVEARLGDRCQLVGGNFFESVPAGADAYLMRHIIHDWNDGQSLTILRNCHAAMRPGGRLLVIESVIPPGNEPCGAKFLDLTMLVIPGGKERTADEYRTLYESSGFRLTRIVPTSAEVSVIEGVRA